MIALGADHGGYELKQGIKQHLEKKGVEFKDFGCHDGNSVDYPDIAFETCTSVLQGECTSALLFCGTGVGISMAANKLKGIRACCCSDIFSAEYTRLHNDANALCLGGRVIELEKAIELVDIFLATPFEGGRHALRVDKIRQLENK